MKRRSTRRNPPKIDEGAGKSKVITFFLRHMQRHKDPRRALSEARAAVLPNFYPEIIEKLLATPAYRWAVVGDPFPGHLRTQRRTQFMLCDENREFTWSAIVLTRYDARLRSFVKLRVEYEKFYLTGNFEAASKVLSEVRVQFGQSVWLISSEIQLLSMWKGLAAQKAYLERILEDAQTATRYAWLAYYNSIRAEENVTLSGVRDIISGINNSGGLRDYATYHLNPYDLSEVENPIGILALEEQSPIIDRLHAHTIVAALSIAKHGSAPKYIVDGLQMLQGICDPTITNLLESTQPRLYGQSKPDWTPFDLYTRGDYFELLRRADFQPELRARARLYAEFLEPPLVDTPAKKIEQVMAEMLSVTEGFVRAKQTLQKLALVCPNWPLALELADFIEGFGIDETEPSPRAYLAALAGGASNPRNALVLDRNQGGAEFRRALRSLSPGSICLDLKHVVVEPWTPEETPEQNSRPVMPTYRQQARQGNSLQLCGRFEEASEVFKRATQHGPQFARMNARLGMFRATLSAGDVRSATIMAVDHFLDKPGVFRLYPLDYLSEAALKYGADREISMSVAVLLHTASRHGKRRAQWERGLSDVYENVLTLEGVKRATELRVDSAQITALFLYFLRYICVPRVMEDSIEFKSVDDIESDRITILRRLMELDPDCVGAYSEEIRSITRDRDACRLLATVEANMVYADEDGLFISIEETLKSSLERYRTLLLSPELDYQAEHISKLVAVLIDKAGGVEAKDLMLINSARDGVLESMVLNFIHAFALDPAHGLNTHLSTTIRHGVLEGRIKTAFSEEDLLASPNGINSWTLPASWSRLAGGERRIIDQISSHLGRFTSKVDELVALFRDELIQVRRVDSFRRGLYVFLDTDRAIARLRELIGPNTDHFELARVLFDACWEMVDASHVEIQSQIELKLRDGLDNATDRLLQSLDGEEFRRIGLVDSVLRARTIMQAKVNEISTWFTRSARGGQAPFELDSAVRVAGMQIENCYGKRVLNFSVEIEQGRSLGGKYLNGFVEVLFLLFQNVVRHSVLEGQLVEVICKIRSAAQDIEIRVSHRIPDGWDLAIIENEIKRALEKHQGSAYLQLAPQERGSGLSKLKRIITHELRTTFTLEISITGDRYFEAAVQLLASDLYAPISS